MPVMTKPPVAERVVVCVQSEAAVGLGYVYSVKDELLRCSVVQSETRLSLMSVQLDTSECRAFFASHLPTRSRGEPQPRAAGLVSGVRHGSGLRSRVSRDSSAGCTRQPCCSATRTPSRGTVHIGSNRQVASTATHMHAATSLPLTWSGSQRRGDNACSGRLAGLALLDTAWLNFSQQCGLSPRPSTLFLLRWRLRS